ncbi:biotin-dependent carboxyltransferase family protein [Natronoglycomyces albus]|uniref:Biotin-dependent carboxyltransferase family protein n=1 Tax=Natronoglycomyces albus TaxID=2811108 RepID=A0A895XIA1_9ACTN|nr:biotin-dependent carboxyltransferase family protein [Natronoglycomyces albus]QSB05541.1 biotin-dependent carboxyltransferase family protein [Natronoglycomyces albus]
MSSIEIVRAGALTTCQDAGRPGWAHLAVPHSGAADKPAWKQANQLAGNPPGACALETTLTGCAFRTYRDVTVVVGGAPCPVTVDDVPVAWGQPVKLPANSVLEAGAPTAGVRSYIAISGGLYPKAVLGSHSTCLLSGLGPAPLRQGDTIPLGPAPARPPYETQWPTPWPGMPAELVLPLHLGPRHDWFSPDSVAVLSRETWEISEHSNRVGLRLTGPTLRRVNEVELPSEGIVTGAVQVPPDGLPIVFGPDHPTTGGYPVIGVVGHEAMAQAAQARVGTPVRFVPLPPPAWSEQGRYAPARRSGTDEAWADT